MVQQIKQTLPDVPAIATSLSVVDAGFSTVANPAGFEDSLRQNSNNREMPEQSGGSSEIARAIDLLNDTALAVAKIHRTARRKQSLELQSLMQAVDALIENFASDPNTLFWALAANRGMYYLSRRSVGCAVWALALGRHLGFDQAALHELLLGALLLDIGKVNVPVVILAKASELNDAEQKFERRHVAESIRMLHSVEGLSAATVEMVHSHHERIDGSGYPLGLKGDEISLYARIAGIVDSYDALSLSRYYASGLSGHAALCALQTESAQKFDPQLLKQFFSAIGEFPTGTWIEFSDGCTGVVCSQDVKEQGGAQVALIADAKQQPFLAVRWLSLHEHSDARALPPAERPSHAAAMERSLQAAIYARRARKY